MTPQEHEISQLKEALGISIAYVEKSMATANSLSNSLQELGRQYFSLLDWLKAEGIDIPLKNDVKYK